MNITLVLWANCFAHFFLCSIWSKEGAFNIIIKVGLLLAALSNLHALWSIK